MSPCNRRPAGVPAFASSCRLPMAGGYLGRRTWKVVIPSACTIAESENALIFINGIAARLRMKENSIMADATASTTEFVRERYANAARAAQKGLRSSDLDPATLPEGWEAADGKIESAFVRAVKPGSETMPAASQGV